MKQTSIQYKHEKRCKLAVSEGVVPSCAVRAMEISLTGGKAMPMPNAHFNCLPYPSDLRTPMASETCLVARNWLEKRWRMMPSRSITNVTRPGRIPNVAAIP